MMMKRTAAMDAVLPLMLVVLSVSSLFQVSYCSRPFPEEPRTNIPCPPVLRRDDGEARVQRHHHDNADGTGTTRPPAGPGMEAGAAGKKATRADGGGGAAPAGDEVDHQVGSGSSNLGGAQMVKTTTTPMRPPVRLRRSDEVPRRVLAGAPPVVVKGASSDSAAKSSCQSGDVHIGCPPSRN